MGFWYLKFILKIKKEKLWVIAIKAFEMTSLTEYYCINIFSTYVIDNGYFICNACFLPIFDVMLYFLQHKLFLYFRKEVIS